ncbi:MAG: hypothetical protein WA459_00015 [Stellaceae bacterium]
MAESPSKRDRATDRFFNDVFEKALPVARIADLPLDSTLTLARSIADLVVAAMRHDLRDFPLPSEAVPVDQKG